MPRANGCLPRAVSSRNTPGRTSSKSETMLIDAWGSAGRLAPREAPDWGRLCPRLFLDCQWMCVEVEALCG